MKWSRLAICVCAECNDSNGIANDCIIEKCNGPGRTKCYGTSHANELSQHKKMYKNFNVMVQAAQSVMGPATPMNLHNTQKCATILMLQKMMKYVLNV